MENQIDEKNVLELLYKACPSFQNIVQKEFDEEEKQLLYVITGRFASYLLHLYQNNELKDFSSIAEFIESLYLHGTEKVQELATLGFLEGIQNVWSNNKINPEVFYQYLLPESKKWWRQLNKFWNGEIKIVGETYNQE
jgi:hypothetical protein